MASLNDENNIGSGKKLKVRFVIPDDNDDDDDYLIPDQKDSSSFNLSDSSLDSDDDDDDNDGGSVTQFPPMQLMTPSGYDPSRIPSAIFSSPNPMEWSVQSNESLFSIHLGNASFSKDHVFALNKSGELPWTNELIDMPPPMTLEYVEEVAQDNKQVERHSISSDTSEESTNLEVENDYNITESSVEVKTNVADQTRKGHNKETNQAMVPSEEAKNYNNVSYQSVESDRSFHFPILTVDGGRNSSSIVESEKQERNEQNQQLEKPMEPPKPETEKTAPNKDRRSWCFCFSCKPCCF
ncbi:unnamed protein product [Lupinus luteus]|uniref:Uncharacterized protein n=1 Tax=Lupinus luteus TaxID=3873 RepID=A0AAV1XJI4_LUPLU